MCFENVKNKNDLIKEIENLDDVETDLILEQCKKNKDINDFITQIAIIKNNFKNLKEQFQNEVRERKEEIEKTIKNYTLRLNQIDSELSHLYSKFHAFEGIVYKEFKETKDDIFKLSDEINKLKIELQTKFAKGINKILITIVLSGISIILGYILNHFFGWIK